jgi:glycosyltransferase involved in cell wall biosynthesis
LRIIIVKPVLPYPPNQGTKRVTLALLKALAAEHDVTLLAPLLDPGEEAAARELERVTGCRVITVLAPNRKSVWHRAWYKVLFAARSLFQGHSPRALYACPEGLMRAGAALTRSAAADLVILEYWYTYPWLDRVRGARTVLLAHDAEFLVNRLAEQSGGGGERRVWADREARREIEACRSVDEIWTLTDADADALAGASGVPRERFVTLPYGVDVPALELPPGGGDAVVFFGAFAADFNRDALQFLLERVWPGIRAARPDARLLVAGGGLPEPLAREVRVKGGEYAGTIGDVRELYRSAAVVLIPLRFGGGLRIRLLEALAASRAVVATSVAVAGTAGENDIHYVVRDNPDDLARAVVQLLERPEEKRRLGEAGHQLVAGHYSESRAADTTREMVRRLAKRPAEV